MTGDGISRLMALLIAVTLLLYLTSKKEGEKHQQHQFKIQIFIEYSGT